MTRYLADSTVLIDYSRGDPTARDWFQTMLNSNEEVGVCPVNVTECLAGARPTERPGWGEVFHRLEYWDIELTDAALAGTWSYDYARRGRQFAATDLLIAAVARRVGAIVVTSNLKDFPQDDIVVQALP